MLRAASVRTGDGHIVSGLLAHLLNLAMSVLLLQNYNPRTMLISIGPNLLLAVELVFCLVLPLLAFRAARAARGMSSRARRELALWDRRWSSWSSGSLASC